VKSCYLFFESGVRSYEIISLTVYGRILTPSDGIHSPPLIVVVDNVEGTLSASTATKNIDC